MISQVLALSLTLFGMQADEPKHILRGGASGIRSQATHAPLPKYPQELLAAGKTGISAVELTISPEGEVLAVKNEESDHEFFYREVKDALMGWRFDFSGMAQGLKRDGFEDAVVRVNFVFYFRRVKDRLVVVDEAEEAWKVFRSRKR